MQNTAAAGSASQAKIAAAPHARTKTWNTMPAAIRTSRSMAPIIREKEFEMKVLINSPNCKMLG